MFQFGKSAAALSALSTIRAEREADLAAAISTVAARYAVPLDVLISTLGRSRASVSGVALAAAGGLSIWGF